MKLSSITLATALALGSLSAVASHHGTPAAGGAKSMSCMGMDHGMMGTDKMSPEQRQMKMDEMFVQMDANSNGSVTKAEFAAHQTAMMAKHRAMTDGMHEHTPPAAAPKAMPEAEHKH